jgi:hypothetical protein
MRLTICPSELGLSRQVERLLFVCISNAYFVFRRRCQREFESSFDVLRVGGNIGRLLGAANRRCCERTNRQ